MGEFLNKIVSFYRVNNWQEILQLNKNSDINEALKILWTWPNEENFQFLKRIFQHYHIRNLISLGCGSGLLEWIIEQSTGVKVMGIEVNPEWWTSKYSIPPFIPLKYAENSAILQDISMKHSALLFCYFNDRNAFKDYVKNYSGFVIIIIGPKDGSERHTEPQPFNPHFEQENWKLIHQQQIKNTCDYIAVYYYLKN